MYLSVSTARSYNIFDTFQSSDSIGTIFAPLDFVHQGYQFNFTRMRGFLLVKEEQIFEPQGSICCLRDVLLSIIAI